MIKFLGINRTRGFPGTTWLKNGPLLWKSQKGFSLVEMAIVMVIIGIIVAAVTVGKGTMQGAETLKAYQKVVVPCVAALQQSAQRGRNVTPTIKQNVRLGGNDALTCTIDIEAGTATIGNSTTDLNNITAQNLEDDNETTVALVEGSTVVSAYLPGM